MLTPITSNATVSKDEEFVECLQSCTRANNTVAIQANAVAIQANAVAIEAEANAKAILRSLEERVEGAGVPAVTPMDKKTVKVSRETYDAAAAPERNFLRLLKEAMHHGQGGKKTEMDACIKSAEHIMNSTKLNEERNRWHANFNSKSECARKLCSQYGLKPAAR